MELDLQKETKAITKALSDFNLSKQDARKSGVWSTDSSVVRNTVSAALNGNSQIFGKLKDAVERACYDMNVDSAFFGPNKSDEVLTYMLDSANELISKYPQKTGRPISQDVIAMFAANINQLADLYGNKTPLNISALNVKGKTIYDCDSAVMGNITTSMVGIQQRVLSAMLNTIGAPIPFAAVATPETLAGGFNATSKLVVVIAQHTANTETGQYTVGTSIDGVNSGRPFTLLKRKDSSSSGTVANTGTSSSTTTFIGRITHIQSSRNKCATTYANGNAVSVTPIRSGSAKVHINGLFVGGASAESTATTGSQTITDGDNSFDYVVTAGQPALSFRLTGSISLDNGAYSIVVRPNGHTTDFPAGATVNVEASLNQELMTDDAFKATIATVEQKITPFYYYADEQLSNVTVTATAAMQQKLELGLDPLSQSNIILLNTSTNEIFYSLLGYGADVGRANPATFAFDWATKSQQKDFAMVIAELITTIDTQSQLMVERTLGIPVTEIFVGPKIAALLRTLPDTYFQSSGQFAQASPYYMGRLKGLYAVWYVPNISGILASTANTLTAPAYNGTEEILLGGTSQTNPALNPLIWGYSIPTMVLPTFPINARLTQGAVNYSKVFTGINQFTPSAKAFTMVTATGLRD